jgi:hypothetical protein
MRMDQENISQKPHVLLLEGVDIGSRTVGRRNKFKCLEFSKYWMSRRDTTI